MIFDHTPTGYIDAAIKMLNEARMNVAAHNGIVSLLTEAKILLNSEQAVQDASSNADGSIKNEGGNKNTVQSAEEVKSDAVEQCNVCGGGKVLIRGRFPKDPKRLVCPSCAVEKLGGHRTTIK